MKRTDGHQTRNGQSTKMPTDAIQALSALASRVSLGYKMGFSHQGDRNLNETLGYPTKLSSADLISRWKRQDIARAIVDRPVKATWRGKIYLQEPDIEDSTPLQDSFDVLMRDLNLKREFMRVDRLSQLGHYAVMLLGFDDSGESTWSQAVEGQRELRYVKVISEKNAEISSWEQDTSNPRYGLPRLYNIKLQHPGREEKTTSIQVHYSRVIHVVSDLLEDEVEAEPVIKTAYNRLMDIEKLVGGSAEMFWRGARPGYAGKADKDYQIDEDTEGKLMDQLKEYEHNLRRFLVTEGVDIESLAQQIADPQGHIKVQLMMLSSLTGIPLRILVGSERGELASSEDDSNWKEWVQDRRTETAEPSILKPFIDKMIITGVLPPPKSEEAGYVIMWPDLFTMDEKERADVGSKRASALSSYAREPMAETLLPFEGFLRYVLRMDETEVDHILEMQEQQLEDLLQEDDVLGEEDFEETTGSRAGESGPGESGS